MSAPTLAQMRHRVVVEEPARVPDGGGGAIVSWVPVAQVWAAIQPLRGSEGVTADRLQGRITHEIWLRWREGVGVHLRLRASNRIFDLKSVVDVGAERRFLRCLAEEVVP